MPATSAPGTNGRSGLYWYSAAGLQHVGERHGRGLHVDHDALAGREHVTSARAPGRRRARCRRDRRARSAGGRARRSMLSIRRWCWTSSLRRTCQKSPNKGWLAPMRSCLTRSSSSGPACLVQAPRQASTAPRSRSCRSWQSRDGIRQNRVDPLGRVHRQAIGKGEGTAVVIRGDGAARSTTTSGFRAEDPDRDETSRPETQALLIQARARPVRLGLGRSASGHEDALRLEERRSRGAGDAGAATVVDLDRPELPRGCVCPRRRFPARSR